MILLQTFLLLNNCYYIQGVLPLCFIFETQLVIRSKDVIIFSMQIKNTNKSVTALLNITCHRYKILHNSLHLSPLKISLIVLNIILLPKRPFDNFIINCRQALKSDLYNFLLPLNVQRVLKSGGKAGQWGFIQNVEQILDFCSLLAASYQRDAVQLPCQGQPWRDWITRRMVTSNQLGTGGQRKVMCSFLPL